MSGPEVKSWATANGLGLVQLAGLFAIFYVFSISADTSRKAVDAHSASSGGHSTLVASIAENVTAIKLVEQKVDLLETQNQREHRQLMEEMQNSSRLIQKIAIKVGVTP